MASNENTTFHSTWYYTNSDRFAILPLVAAFDKRLSASDFRVLIALASYANAAGKCWPRRSTVGELTGITPPNVSRATTRLADYGWLTKKQTGETSTYFICAPAELTHHLKKRSPEVIQTSADENGSIAITPRP